MLASIGIVKGQPFEPTPKQQELLEQAVETAPRMILALRQLGRADGRDLYYEDRQYAAPGPAAPPNGCRTAIST